MKILKFKTERAARNYLRIVGAKNIQQDMWDCDCGGQIALSGETKDQKYMCVICEDCA